MNGAWAYWHQDGSETPKLRFYEGTKRDAIDVMLILWGLISVPQTRYFKFCRLRIAPNAFAQVALVTAGAAAIFSSLFMSAPCPFLLKQLAAPCIAYRWTQP